MTLANLQTTVRQAITVKVILESGIELRLQNFLPTAPYIFNGEKYNYSPLEYSGIARSSNLDNSSATIYLPNVPLIAHEVWNNDGFRKAIVLVTLFFPENPEAIPIQDKLLGKGSKFANSRIEVQLQSAFSAVGAYFPSLHYRTGSGNGDINIIGLVPELPRSGSV